jgi:methenyltetrahydromethanopterin cyclohydrolase
MISINESATRFVDELLDKEEELDIKSHYLENKSMLIDCGVETAGSIGAGILYSMISLGGLGKVSISPGVIDSFYINFIQTYIDKPAIACLCSQKPAWKLKTEGYVGTAYGPARAISQKPKAIFSAVHYEDDAETAVVNIETSSLPTVREMEYIAKQCSTDPECVVALVSRPNSIVGSVVNGTRPIEWMMNRLLQLGYPVNDVSSASSVCPMAPIFKDEQDFVGASFDSIAYYGMLYAYVKGQDDKFKDTVSSVSASHGKNFKALLKEMQGDYSKVDQTMFAPGSIVVNGLGDGSLRAYGTLDPSMLLRSYGLKI